MEWWKLFSGTFVLIFLAELGDKTQLAAMAKTADSPGDSSAKWVVFLAASLALVASTFIAVFLGHLLKTVVPDERYIKIAAGSLFLIFGFLILYETYQSFAAGEKPTPSQTAAVSGTAGTASGIVGGLALRAAMDFESFAAGRYRRLAETATPALREILLQIASEEDGHLAKLGGLPAAGPREPVVGDKRDISTRRLIAATKSDTLEDLIRHEEATADFYGKLAERALIPSARAVFARLADDERSHANRLSEIAGKLG